MDRQRASPSPSPAGSRGKPGDGTAFGISRRTFLQLLQAGVLGPAVGFGAAALAQERMRLLDTLPLLVVTGILQPASAESVFRFLEALAGRPAGPVGLQAPPQPEVDERLRSLAGGDEPLLIEVLPAREAGPFYSLTAAGEAMLGSSKGVQIDLRRLRDSVRLYLLRGPRGGMVKGSREWVGAAVGGDTLSSELWLPINELGMGAPTFVPAGLSGMERRSVRFRDTMSAIFDRTEASAPSRGTLVTFEGPPQPLRYLSFASFDQVRQARRPAGRAGEFEPEDLALCFGISLTRLNWMAIRRKTGQYRTFEIAKSSGGKRVIESRSWWSRA